MKSVSLSQVVRTQPSCREPGPARWRELGTLALTLSAGLVLIAFILMTLDPLAPAAWIVIPVLLGGTLPLFAALPGQFDVVTRFDASHFIKTLDASLAEMGYAASGANGANGRVVCYKRRPRLFDWKGSTISLAVHEHAITVGGPVPALRRLQQRLGT